MCMSCWEDEGRPWDASDTARKWAGAFGEADPFGALHIVVSDWNLDDACIAHCRAGTTDPAERALCDALAEMSEAERWACAILSDRPDFNPATYPRLE